VCLPAVPGDRSVSGGIEARAWRQHIYETAYVCCEEKWGQNAICQRSECNGEREGEKREAKKGAREKRKEM